MARPGAFSFLRPRLRPSFLIIGAQKAGTSALFKMLAHHPQVLAPEVKELHFFDVDKTFKLGLRHYWRHYPRPGLFDRGMVTFEATPAYLFRPEPVQRIHEALPQVRMVAVLRDPVKRAYSAWNMFRDFKRNRTYGHLHDTRSFEQAVEEEMRGAEMRWEHRYLARGHYAEQLTRYFDVFGREPLLVLRYAELKKDPAGTLERVCAHVGLEPHTFDPSILKVRDNVRAYPEPLDPALAERLYRYFAPRSEELQKLLGPEWDLDERGN